MLKLCAIQSIVASNYEAKSLYLKRQHVTNAAFYAKWLMNYTSSPKLTESKPRDPTMPQLDEIR